MGKMASATILILFLAGSLGSVLNAKPFTANGKNTTPEYTSSNILSSLPVLNIDTDLSYLTIQEAINAPETLSGHHLLLYPIVFYEHVVVNKSLSFCGSVSLEYPEFKTTVSGNGTDNVITIESNDVEMIEISVVNGSTGIYLNATNSSTLGPGLTIANNTMNGIYLFSSSNNSISENTIVNSQYGIHLEDSLNNTICRNNVTNNGGGILVENDYTISENNNTISENSITANSWYGIYLYSSLGSNISGNAVAANYFGFFLERSSNNTISGNNIANNEIGTVLWECSNNFLRDNAFADNSFSFDIWGWDLSFFVNDVDSSNTVNGKPIYYWLSRQNLDVPLDAGYVLLANCSEIRIENLNSQTITLAYTVNCTVSGNNATNYYSSISLRCSSGNIVSGNNDFGILVIVSSGNTILGNAINDHNSSIHLLESSGNTIVGNNVTNHDWGIVLYSSSSNTVARNNIVDNNEGILLDDCSSNAIAGNNIVDNYEGIYLDYSSDNTIKENNIVNNYEGIFLHGASNNSIYHNNFINDTIPAYYFYTPKDNVWDDGYPSGGNYWSNYNATDSNYDALADTYYLITAGNADTHPLMGVYADFKATLEYNVQTVCNSSISGFQFNGTAISFDVTGADGTIGFCRISIPTALMNVTYKVYVNGTEVSYSLLPVSNETYSYLYFNYTHSTQEVIITPQFPSFLILPLFMIATLLAVIVYKRKLLQPLK